MSIILLLAFISSVMWVVSISNKEEAHLKSDHFYFEYGDNFNLEKDTILETTNPETLKSLEIDASNLELEAKEDFLAVGSYQLSAHYREFYKTKVLQFTVDISDTTAPTFIEYPKRIDLLTDDEAIDIKSYFKVEDLSDFALDLNTANINFEEEGEHKLKAHAVDEYGNESTQEFMIVIEAPVVIEEIPEPEENIPEVENPSKPKPDAPKDTAVNPTYVDGILIVNKKNPLPAHFHPGENANAVAQLKTLIHDMQTLGYDISNAYSGFRSYSYQEKLYNRYVAQDGKQGADTYSARPGYSEHQSGLTYDLKHNNGALVTKDAEAKWISEHAHNYGFIVRYQAGKESITGYQAEPWHLRYIGNRAEEIYNSNLSLEEFLGVEGGGYLDDI